MTTDLNEEKIITAYRVLMTQLDVANTQVVDILKNEIKIDTSRMSKFLKGEINLTTKETEHLETTLRVKFYNYLQTKFNSKVIKLQDQGQYEAAKKNLERIKNAYTKYNAPVGPMDLLATNYIIRKSEMDYFDVSKSFSGKDNRLLLFVEGRISSGKSSILKDIQKELNKRNDYRCLYIDLEEILEDMIKGKANLSSNFLTIIKYITEEWTKFTGIQFKETLTETNWIDLFNLNKLEANYGLKKQTHNTMVIIDSIEKLLLRGIISFSIINDLITKVCTRICGHPSNDRKILFSFSIPYLPDNIPCSSLIKNEGRLIRCTEFNNDDLIMLNELYGLSDSDVKMKYPETCFIAHYYRYHLGGYVDQSEYDEKLTKYKEILKEYFISNGVNKDTLDKSDPERIIGKGGSEQLQTLGLNGKKLDSTYVNIIDNI